MEISFYQSLGISQGNPMIFFRRPISAVLLSLVFLLLASLCILKTVQKRAGAGVQGRSFTAVTNLFRDVLLSANSVLEVTS